MKKNLVAIFLISTVFAVDCNYCKDSISEKPYSVYGRNYHKSCLICHHCNESIEEDFLRYSFDEHMYHANNSCNQLCMSCHLRKGIEYSNGMIQCEKCHDKIVQKPKDILTHKTYVLELLSSYGFNDLSEANISIEIVNYSQMIKVKKKAFGFIYRLFKDVKVTKGFAVHNKKGIGKNKKHSCKIYIVDNLHELDFRATLAHEYLHAWMMINDIHSHYWKFNDISMTEGFAQLGSYLVFADEGSLLGKKKIEFNLDLYDENNYGEGYRKMKVCVDYYGWDRLIEKLLNKKDLSCFDDKNLLYLNMNKINN